MSMSWFLDEIERRLEDERQSRREMESQLAQLSQMVGHVANMASAPRSGGAGFYVGKATSAISARSGATLGSGTYKVYSTAGGTLTATGVTGTAYNAGGAIASGKHVALQKESTDGTMMAAPLEC